MSVFKNLKIPSDIFDENISIKLLESLRLNDGEILLNIKEDIPENSLSIARARQVNKEGWKDKRK